MRGAIPPLSQYVFVAWYLAKHRHNFTFTFTPIPVACPLYIPEYAILQLALGISELTATTDLGHAIPTKIS
jgi:hypothetical protein